jgi:hypothetical protein
VQHTPVRPLTRAVLVVAVALVALAGLQVYLLAARTGDYFAWTIKAPLSAAFLGAGYLSSLPSFAVALVSREWARIRVLLVMALVFTTVSLVATLRHFSAFHIGDGPALAQVAAWGWLAVYAVIPPALAVALVDQEGAGGRREYEVRAPVIPLMRIVLLAHALPLTVLGLWLTLRPGRLADSWPWPLPDLPAAAIGAWLLGTATGAWWSLRDREWRRLRIAVPAFLLFPLLLLFAALRYRDRLDGDASTAVYVSALVVSLLAVVVAVWRQERLLRAESGEEPQR